MWIGNTGILHNAELRGFHSLPNIMLATCFVLLLLLLLLQEEKDESMWPAQKGKEMLQTFLRKT